MSNVWNNGGKTKEEVNKCHSNEKLLEVGVHILDIKQKMEPKYSYISHIKKRIILLICKLSKN